MLQDFKKFKNWQSFFVGYSENSTKLNFFGKKKSYFLIEIKLIYIFNFDATNISLLWFEVFIDVAEWMMIVNIVYFLATLQNKRVNIDILKFFMQPYFWLN